MPINVCTIFKSPTRSYCVIRHHMLCFSFLGLWALVNNAGVAAESRGPIEWGTVETFRNCCEVNLFGSIDATLCFLPLVKKAKGRVVFVSSGLGQLYSPIYAAYVVSKRGIEAFADVLRYIN